MPPSHHRERIGVVEVRAAGQQGDGFLSRIDQIHVLPPGRGRRPHSQYAVLAVQENLAVLRQVVPDQRRHADAEVDVRAFGDVACDARGDLVTAEFRVVPAAARIAVAFFRGTFTTRVTKIPGVTMHSGSSAPSATVSYTCAMVHFAALAMVGPKFRALFLYTRFPQRSPFSALTSATSPRSGYSSTWPSPSIIRVSLPFARSVP